MISNREIKFSTRQLKIVLLVSIVLIGFGLRAYNFSPWLHFELDQARDARVIDDALDGGPGELTLLGPKAGGTFLRLAPGFYYLQYLSGLVFGGTPTGIALIVMILSVASVPLFYLFLRRYFSFSLSLLLTLLFSTSAFFVMYGRFAWNPNIMPFFVIFGMYALLRAIDKDEPKKERWFLGAVFLLTLATHAHFLAFLAVPAIAGIFLLWKRPIFPPRSWFLAFTLVAVLYLPMVLNEIETKGSNTREFFGAITEKSTKENHALAEKFLRDGAEHSLGALLITTGFEGGTFPALTWNEGRIWWTCGDKCDQGKWYGVVAGAFFLASLLAFVWLWWKETDQRKKDFLSLVGTWFVVTFLLFLPLSYGFAPRFFLLSGMLFPVFLGFLLIILRQLLGNGRLGKFVSGGAILLLVASNLFFLSGRFDELARAGTEVVKNAPDRILKERIRVTLEQQEQIIDMLEARSEEQDYPVYMSSEPQYKRALKYLLEKRGVQNGSLGLKEVYSEGVYFLVLRTQSDFKQALMPYLKSYMIGDTTSFGTLSVIELLPKSDAVVGGREDFSLPKINTSTAPMRYTWSEFFGGKGSSLKADQEADTLDQTEEDVQDQ